MLGVIVSIDQEAETIIKKKYKEVFVHHIAKRKYLMVETANKTYVPIVFSGFGKVNATHAACNLITDFKVNAILNLGMSKTFYNNLNLLDLVLVKETCNLDNPHEAYYQESDLNRKIYNTSRVLNSDISNILKLSDLTYITTKCLSSDINITPNNYTNYFLAADSNNECFIIDNEAAAIGQVCSKLNVKFGCVKIVYEKIHTTVPSTSRKTEMSKIYRLINTLIYNLIEAITYNANK